MTLCTNANGDRFEALLEVAENEVDAAALDYPLTHALVVARAQSGFLLLFNAWKNHWEVAGGILEPGESLRECAIREMAEETNQVAARLVFRGLMKFVLSNGKTEYGGLFCASIEERRPFAPNDEAREIVFWDRESDIGYVDEIDLALLDYYLEPQ